MKIRKIPIEESQKSVLTDLSSLLWQLPQKDVNRFLGQLCRAKELRAEAKKQREKDAVETRLGESLPQFYSEQFSDSALEEAVDSFVQKGRLNLSRTEQAAEELYSDSNRSSSIDSDGTSLLAKTDSEFAVSEGETQDPLFKSTFAEFFNTHKLSFMHEDGNSILFKVENLEGTEAAVLKVGCLEEGYEALCLDGAIADMDGFSVETLYRNSEFFFEGDQRTMEVMPFYQQSLKDYAKAESDFERESFLPIAKQLLAHLRTLNQKAILFSDPGCKNWMVIEKEGRPSLVAVDKKSLKSKQALMDSRDPLLLSPGYIAPEFKQKGKRRRMLDINQAHAFLYGKWLYELLTLKEANSEDALFQLVNGRQLERREIMSGENFSFQAPFFKTLYGQQLKRLICALVQPEPSKRLSLTHAAVVLEILSALAEDKPLSLTQSETRLKDYYLAKLKSSRPEAHQRLQEAFSHPIKAKFALIQLLCLMSEYSNDSQFANQANANGTGRYSPQFHQPDSEDTDSESSTKLALKGYEIDEELSGPSEDEWFDDDCGFDFS